MKHINLFILCLFALSLFSTGCVMSSRATTTLKPQKSATLSKDGMKFWIEGVVFSPEESHFKPGSTYNAMAMRAYPALFSNDTNAWPIRVVVEGRKKQIYHYGAWTILTFGVLPCPIKESVQYEIITEIPGVESKSISFEMEKAEWAAWIPLGLIPVPGASDARSYFDMAQTAINDFTMACIVEAAAQQVKQIDASAIKNLLDPTILRGKALHDNNPFARVTIASKLNDQAIFIEQALNDSSDYVRKVAQAEVTQTNLLYTMLADTSSDNIDRFFFDSPAQIAKAVATDAPDAKVRQAALRHVRDEAFIQTVAQKDPDASVRQTAITLVEEGADWALAEKAGTLSAYKEFLQKHPSTTRLHVTTAGRNFRTIWSIRVAGEKTGGALVVEDEQGNSFKVSIWMACDAGMVDDPGAEKPRPSVNDFQNFQQEQQRKSRQKFRLYSTDFGKENCRVVAIELLNP
jgi:hypothetical protein